MEPIRCFTCGKVLSGAYTKFHQQQQQQQEGEEKSVQDIWTSLGIRRYCCKRMIVSSVSLIDTLIEYEQVQHEKEDSSISKSTRRVYKAR
jgi:DNA-directed RNA polymerase subunit N